MLQPPISLLKTLSKSSLPHLLSYPLVPLAPRHQKNPMTTDSSETKKPKCIVVTLLHCWEFVQLYFHYLIELVLAAQLLLCQCSILFCHLLCSMCNLQSWGKFFLQLWQLCKLLQDLFHKSNSSILHISITH